MRRSSVLETRCLSVGPSSRSELASLLLYQDWGVKYDGEDCQVKKKKETPSWETRTPNHRGF